MFTRKWGSGKPGSAAVSHDTTANNPTRPAGNSGKIFTPVRLLLVLALAAFIGASAAKCETGDTGVTHDCPDGQVWVRAQAAAAALPTGPLMRAAPVANAERSPTAPALAGCKKITAKKGNPRKAPKKRSSQQPCPRLIRAITAFSDHARERMEERGITESDVRRIVADGDHVGTDRDAAGCKYRIVGGIGSRVARVVLSAAGVVVTVLWE